MTVRRVCVVKIVSTWSWTSCISSRLSRRWLLIALTGLTLLGGASGANAADLLVIPITRGNDRATPIAVVPFRWQGAPLTDKIDEIVSFDLARSGQFVPLPKGDMLSLPTAANEIIFRDWKVQGMRYLVIGRLVEETPGRFAATYELYQVGESRRIATETLHARKDQMRDLAHVISDAIYEKITHIRGAFSTKIIYVLAQNFGTPKARFRLDVSDSDGARSRSLFQSKQPIMSPTWSPDARKVAYVTFESGRSVVVLQDIATGARETLANFHGINSGPSFAPDGRNIAMVLSRDGNPEIYMMDLGSRRLRQLTHSSEIDTEPSFMADGRNLVFTSNRGGKPQIYSLDVATGLPERISFDGVYNARPRALNDGRNIAYVHRAVANGPFHIAVLDMVTGRNRTISETSLDESPSVAPNGMMLIFATVERGRGILSVVSVDGRVKFRLPSSDGDVREPAWSPYLDVRSGLQ